MSDLMLETPTSYAKRLAGYISSPTKIESLTRIEFGRAPPLHVIARMRLLVEEQNRSRTDIGEPEESDGLEYSVPTFVKKNPRVRDYIIVAAPPPPADNPFIGLYSTGKRLIASVAADFGLTPEDLTGQQRYARLVAARSVVVTLLKQRGWSYPAIGRVLGGRDHSTVINAAKNFDIYARQNSTVHDSFERHLKLIEEAELVAREASGELLSDEPTGADSNGSAVPVDNAA